MSAATIDARQARQNVEVADALLVCSYDSNEKFEANRLEGAISLDDLRQQEDSLSKDREIIFY